MYNDIELEGMGFMERLCLVLSYLFGGGGFVLFSQCMSLSVSGAFSEGVDLYVAIDLVCAREKVSSGVSHIFILS